MTLSKERLEEMTSGDSSRLITVSEALAMARELLERRERDAQEPVATAHRLVNKLTGSVQQWKFTPGTLPASEGDTFQVEVMPLYAAPPASVVQPAIDLWNRWADAEDKIAPPAPVTLVNRLDTLLNGEEATGNKTDDDIYKDVSSLLEHALYLAERAKACRAAMLQSFGKSEQLNSPAVPDGWVMVPIDPTWSMLSADGCSKHHGGQECSHHENRKRIWRAMLAAAPKQETN